MTKLEQKFFATFNINPKYIYTVTDTFYTNNSHTYSATKLDLINEFFEGKNCGRYKVIKVDKVYPKITDTHYLQLLCWVNQRRILPNCNVTQLKEYILQELSMMIITQQFKNQVKLLFEETE